MNSILKNILAILAGAVIGGVVNMGIIILGPSIIPAPAGVNVQDMESIAANMHLYQPKHFIVPFLAHSIGTLVGAIIAARIASTFKITFAMLIGLLFLTGGIMSVMMLPSPTWFTILDLAGAYIPMAWAGGKIGIKMTPLN